MRFDFKIKNNQLFLVVGIVGYFNMARISRLS